MTLSAAFTRPARGMRVPAHVGVIPDGNRRWAQARGMPKSAGYENGIEPAKRFYDLVWDLGIQEVSAYVFTKENTHRPKEQILAFVAAFQEFIHWIEKQDVSVLLVGDTRSSVFPRELEYLTVPDEDRSERRRLNLLVNYSWKWDVGEAVRAQREGTGRVGDPMDLIGSRHVSRIDLVVRWGGRSRLSGFLPLQAAYADLYVVDAYWPDFETGQFFDALSWYGGQDVTMGG